MLAAAGGAFLAIGAVGPFAFARRGFTARAPEHFQTLPYVLALVPIAGVSGRSAPRAAGGKPDETT